jgi:hypothetical protein
VRQLVDNSDYASLFKIPAGHVDKFVRLRSGMEWVGAEGERGFPQDLAGAKRHLRLFMR